MTVATRTPTGGSRETWFLETGDGAQAVLRIEAGGSFAGTDINVEREATVYRALEKTEVPAPRLLGVAPGGAAILLERLPGSAELGATDEERRATLVDFVDAIAALHRLDVDALDLAGFDRPRTPEDHARLDLARWHRLADDAGVDLDPLSRYAGAYLLAHPPARVTRTCLVQGDTGPGNFVASGGRVTGLVDMEFAHLGDPMDDLAWILMRGLGGDPVPYLDRYRKRSGIEVDGRSVAYYAIAVQYRCAITTTLAVTRGGGARGWAPYLMVTERYLQGTAAALSAYLGVDEPPVQLPEGAPTDRTPWYDHLLEGIRAGVRGIADEDLREHTRNEQILVHYLRAYDRLGHDLDALDRVDLEATGIDPDDPGALRAAAEAGGEAADETLLRYLLRRSQRRRTLWATLLDRPARGAAPWQARR
ncbi:MAG TPA: phosphotransferase family protein [Acidimicrobiales bacterium]|nr:phosphotransferase family protein [Acidimicrobiales bacterium]